MGEVPWKAMIASSAAAAYLVASRSSDWSRWSLFLTFTLAYTVQFAGWGLHKVIIYPKFTSPLRHVPSPAPESWWNGNWARIAKEPTGVPQIDWINNIPNNGLIRYLGMFNQERILLTNPEALREVLVTKNYDFPKPAMMTQGISQILGKGILLEEGDEHKRQRRHLMPAFAFRHIKDLYPLFWEKSAEVTKAMTVHISRDSRKTAADAAGQGVEMEVGGWASRATLDIIGVAGLGHDFNAISNPDNALNKAYQRVFKPSGAQRYLQLASIFLPRFIVANLPLKHNYEMQAATAMIRQTCADLVASKSAKLASKSLNDVDILSIAIESGGFTPENLVDQMMTFLAAGHETTASSLQWAIYLLCLNPEAQRRLREEVRAHISSLDAEVTPQDIDHMPYLQAVCSETLRYFSPVALTLREAAKDTTVQGVMIPKGTRVLLCPWAVNRCDELWGGDARRFDPNRWLADGGVSSNGTRVDAPEKISAAHGGATSNYSMLTFLHGPRSCIGSTFAKAEFACLLAAWVGRFEFELVDKEEMDEDKMQIKGGITQRPKNGLNVYVKVVEGW